MKFDPARHHRRSLRLQGYDYAQAGAYFATICTQQRECVFGKIAAGEMRLNEAGRMVERWWAKLTEKFPSVETDAFIIMPNHMHGIVVLVGAAPCGRPGEEVRGGVPRCTQAGGGHPHGG
ncbi:MAG: hypothetical protein ACRERD_16110, partial [Candidatus Binatia bacterium]